MPHRPSVFASRLLLTTALAYPVAALGQTAGTGGAADDALVDIVVTSQKREESVQKVPISEQVLTGEKIDQLVLKSFDDYIAYLPSVNFTTGGGGTPGNESAIFRGVATDGGLIASGTLPTVGIYLDEQPITSISGSLDIHLYDIARIEALAGPQGSLFGASSEAGTIRIISNKPDPNKFSGSVDFEFNDITTSGDPGGVTEGYVNIPIVPGQVALRVSGWYNHVGGYIDNAPRSRTYPSSGITQTNAGLTGTALNASDQEGLRAQLGINLDENWTITPSIVAQRSDWNGTYRSDDTKVGELKVGHFFPEFGSDRFYQAGLTITGKIADFDITYAGNFMDRTQVSQFDYSDYGFYYDAIAGSGEGVVDNAGNLINPAQLNRNKQHTLKHSEELRIASPQDQRARVIAGLFYQRQSEDGENDYLDAGFADRLSIPGRPGQLWLTHEERIDRDRAAFGQVDFDVTDQFTLTAGGRIYDFHNQLGGFYGVNTTYFGTGVRQCLGPKVGPYGLGAVIVDGTPCTNLGVLNPDGSVSPKKSDGDGTTWRLNATYRFDADHLVYYTQSTGFRPGGINRAGTAAPFGPDYLTNYEIGTKNTFLDHRMTVNLTGFIETWKGVQVTYQAPGSSGVALIANAGSARTRGFEGDVHWQVVPSLGLTGGFTYVDAQLTSPLYTGSTTPNAPAGTRLPLTPPWKWDVIGRYVFEATDDIDGHAQLAASYTGTRSTVLTVSDERKYGPLPSYFTLDATAGLNRGNTALEVFIRNLTDARGQRSRAAECNINYCGPSRYDPVGEVYRVYIQPRTVGIRLSQKF